MGKYKYNLEFELNENLRINSCNDCPVSKHEDMNDDESCNMFGCYTSECQVPKACKLIEKQC